MQMVKFRVFVEENPLDGDFIQKKKNRLQDTLNIKNIVNLRLFHVYDVIATRRVEEKIDDFIMEAPLQQKVSSAEILSYGGKDNFFGFGVTLRKGQFDARGEALYEALDVSFPQEIEYIQTSLYYLWEGNISTAGKKAIQSFLVNDLDETIKNYTLEPEKPAAEKMQWGEPYYGFIKRSHQELGMFHNKEGFSMSFEDLVYVQDYFKTEDRDPTHVELNLIDTYWSDHCRHQTFSTHLKDIEIAPGPYQEVMTNVLDQYKEARKTIYEDAEKPITLMEMATLGMKLLQNKGTLNTLEDSDEDNAASIVIDVDHDGETEEWLLLFKNETHNHPTEIEPFGGAGTCLGGAIRDPLSGRGYSYQAMRITGAGNPLTLFSKTLKGKLPQGVITQKAMEGYASYGRQVGVPAGLVKEFYHDGFVAKRLEMGAILAAAKKDHVGRRPVQLGDLIILLGGKTGKDGIGGATGSSKEQTKETIENAFSEVQKGNPSEERKIIRLFKDSEASKMIVRSNDFGAGGAAVAIGELAPGVLIMLDRIPTKYPGLSATELALSESQERMAVVIDMKHKKKFLELATLYDVPATHVATVNSDKRLTMFFKSQKIVSLSRKFLNSHGASREMDVLVKTPMMVNLKLDEKKSAKETLIHILGKANIASQKGLIEKFDTSLGKNILLAPFGGKNMETPENIMAAKIPVTGETKTISLMSFGYDPDIASQSPFHGGMLAVFDSIAKLIAGGAKKENIYLSFQEYFERLERDPEKWGKPFQALLGAFNVQSALGIPAISGKDSMSGSFGDIHVPPTLISVSVAVSTEERLFSRTLQGKNSKLLLLKTPMNELGIPDFEVFLQNIAILDQMIEKGQVKAISSIGHEGVLAAIVTMTFGNHLGLDINLPKDIWTKMLFGSFIIEVDGAASPVKSKFLSEIGGTTDSATIKVAGETIPLKDLFQAFKGPLKNLFSSYSWQDKALKIMAYPVNDSEKIYPKIEIPREKVKVLLPIFRGSVSEYDFYNRFTKAGAEVEFFFLQTGSVAAREMSLIRLADKMLDVDIIIFQDAYSFGDLQEDGGKLLAALINESPLKRALEVYLEESEGLILGVGAGMQTLLKLGLLPTNDFKKQTASSPIATKNISGEYISTMGKIKCIANESPWLQGFSLEETFMAPIAAGEGRIYLPEDLAINLFENGQIPFIYVDGEGNMASTLADNPFGSDYAVASMLSENGRILGLSFHPERMDDGLFKNVGKLDTFPMFENILDHFEYVAPIIEIEIDLEVAENEENQE